MDAYVVLYGIGGVGIELVKQITNSQAKHRAIGFNIHFLGLADSSALITATNHMSPLTIDQVKWVIESKEKNHNKSKLFDLERSDIKVIPQNEADPSLISFANRCAVFVDCTATNDTIRIMKLFLQHGGKVVSANKKPFSSSMQDYKDIKRHWYRVRHESSVGAGLPVIATVQRMMMSGDRIDKISGTFSGTLGFLFSNLPHTVFSKVLNEAYELGYTEPDPRDDLCGIDVARKLLILAREIGWEVEMDNVKVEALFPTSMQNISLKDFFAGLKNLDEYFIEKVIQAEKQSCALQYVGSLEEGKLKVGMKMVPKNSPLGQLSGADNLIQIYSQVYSASPLVIRGPGAGAECTASGVLSDIVELIFTKN